MATKVHMEALSPTMEEGQVVKWHKAEGDAVSSGDLLAEIETDKATMELTARGEGVLRAILVSEGGVAPVGDVIAVIAGESEDIESLVGAAASSAPGNAEEESRDASPAREDAGAEARPAGRSAGEPGGSEEAAASAAPDEAQSGAGDEPAAEGAAAPPASGRVKASPLARRLASEAGLDLASVKGSGPGGRVVKRDVEAAREAGAEAEPALAGASEGYDEVRVSQMRKTIARRLTESLAPVPHFFLTVDVDMSRVLEGRRRVNELLEAFGDRVSVNDIVLKATAAALRRHPEINAAWHGDHIRRYHHVHVGVAVAVEDGLITPVVKHADAKGLVQIGREVREMAGRARERRLTPDEYTGATFSVSNLGMFGIEAFTAIINPPEAGILAVGKTREVPVVEDGAVVVRPRMKVTMSCDHRVIDGATGARFLQTLQGMLEEPTAMLV